MIPLSRYRFLGKRDSKRAFTLIELSVVLIVIGLLVGGVLVGRDLVSSSQLRAEVTQFEKINSAVNTFKGKFDCLPGDCLNATSLLPNVSNYNCAWYGPCGNGNGDGIISDVGGNTYPTTIDGEPLQF